MERAVLANGRSTRLIVDDEHYQPHPEALEYVFALQAADRSPHTVKTYLTPIAWFLTWCDAEGVDWRGVHLLHMTRFKYVIETLPTRSGGPRAVSSVSLALTAVCEFLRYYAAAGHVDQRWPSGSWTTSGSKPAVAEERARGDSSVVSASTRCE